MLRLEQQLTSLQKQLFDGLLIQQQGHLLLCDSDYCIINGWSADQSVIARFGQCLLHHAEHEEQLQVLFREVRLDQPAVARIDDGPLKGVCYLSMTACPHEEALHYILFHTEEVEIFERLLETDHEQGLSLLACLELYLPGLVKPAVLTDENGQVLRMNILAQEVSISADAELGDLVASQEQLSLPLQKGYQLVLLDYPQATSHDIAEELLRAVGYWSRYTQEFRALGLGFRQLGKAMDFELTCLLEYELSSNSLKSRCMGIWARQSATLQEHDYVISQLLNDLKSQQPDYVDQLSAGRRLMFTGQSLHDHEDGAYQILCLPVTLQGYLKAVWFLVRPMGQYFWNLTQLMRFAVLERQLSSAISSHWDQVVADKTRHDLERNVRIRTSSLSESMVKLEQEVHQRIKAQNELELTHRQMQSILTIVPDRFYHLNADGQVKWVSEEDALPLPWLKSAQVGELIDEAWPEGLVKSIQKHQAEVQDQRQLITFEYARTFEGEEYWLELRLIPYLDQDLLLTLRDISGQVQLRENLKEKNAELVHVQRVTTLSQIMVELAHELNQPLGAIVNYSNILKRSLGGSDATDDESIEMLETIAQQSLRASKMIRHSRLLMRKHEGDRELLNIEDLLENTSSLVSWQAGRKGVELTIRSEPEMRPLMVVGIHIEQVLVNLILNAIEASEAAEASQEAALVEVEAWAREDQGWHIEVRDNGPGVTPEKAKQIFEAYYTTKEQGLGMGLAISRTLIESHGGRLECEPGERGGCFVIELPMVN